MGDYDGYAEEVETTSGPEVQYVDEYGRPCDENGNLVEMTGGPSVGLTLPPAVQKAFNMMGLALPGMSAPARPKPAAPAPRKVIQLPPRGVAPAPRKVIQLPRKPAVPTLANGHPLAGPGLGMSGMLGGELQANGADLLFSATFVAVGGVWGGAVTILRPGVCTLWDVSAQSDDYNAAWIKSVNLNTIPWTIPAGSEEAIASFSYKRNFVLAPKVAFVSPGWSLIVSGAAAAPTNTYRWQGFGIASPAFDTMSPELLRYIHRNAHDQDIRNAVLLG